MFDQKFYNIVFEMMNSILSNNINIFGQDFASQFMASYDIRRGQQSQQNAQNLMQMIGQACQRMNGSNQFQSEQQLYGLLANHIQNTFDQNRPQVNRFGGSSGGFQQNNFGGNMMGGSMSSGFGGQQMGRISGGAALADDSPAPSQPMTTSSGNRFAEPTTAKPSFTPKITYSDNPLDDVGDASFSSVKSHDGWGREGPKDRRIVVAKHTELKARSGHVIHKYDAYHQLIQKDVLDVVRDFFEVVPDQILGAPFLFNITYNYLSVIDVPTREFQLVRSKCADYLADRTDTPLHKHIGAVLNTMQRGPWKAITTYLVAAINRALYLALRLSGNPQMSIDIDTFEDIDELFSSSFNHPFTIHPGGREKLEKIVSTALWNALVMNSSPMFIDGEVPTAAMQLSPAFPFSLNGVYPNKYAIPTSDNPTMVKFKEELQKNELAHRTYVVSNMSVIITNILGKTVLPMIGDKVASVDHPTAHILSEFALPYVKEDLVEGPAAPNTLLSEDLPEDVLTQYFEDPEHIGEAEMRDYGRLRPVSLPTDRTVFAIQYGVEASKYIQGIDILSTIDEGDKSKPLLVKHSYDSFNLK